MYNTPIPPLPSIKIEESFSYANKCFESNQNKIWDAIAKNGFYRLSHLLSPETIAQIIGLGYVVITNYHPFEPEMNSTLINAVADVKSHFFCRCLLTNCSCDSSYCNCKSCIYRDHVSKTNILIYSK